MEKLEGGSCGDFVRKVSFGLVFFPSFWGEFLPRADGPPGRRRSSRQGGRTALIGRLGQSPKLAQHILGAPWTLPNTFGRGTAQRGRHGQPQIACAARAGEPPGRQPLLCSSLRVWLLIFFRISRPSGMFSVCECSARKIPKAPPSRPARRR